MNKQFSGMSEVFHDQVQSFIAYNCLYAARQVLLLNRELGVRKRVQAVKAFFGHSATAHSFQETQKHSCSRRFKWKLRLAAKNQPFLLLILLKCNDIFQKIQDVFEKNMGVNNRNT